MKKFAKSHFPSSKEKFNIYLKQFLPLIMGTLLFALNGVVDNFMVGGINQGVTALSAANQWTAIIMGWLIAVAGAGGVIISQFYHDNRIEYVKRISRYRLFLGFIFVIPFMVLAWTTPDSLISLFFEEGDVPSRNALVYKNGRDYLQIIAFQWFFIVFSHNMGNQLAELGHGKYRMYFGFGTLSMNIFLNAILIYVARMGVSGAAIASVGARILFIILATFVIIKNKLPLSFNIFKIFQTGKEVQKIYWRRWVYVLSIFTVSFFIIFRAFFYSKGYPMESLGIGVSSASVLGLTGALMHVFTITFGALASMTTIFVSSELGKGNAKQAKINADELKGFNTFMSMILAFIMLIFAFCVPYVTFLSQNQYDQNGNLTFDSKAQLRNVRNSLLTLGLFYPIWIWFSTSYRNGNAGGKGNKFAIFDWVATGLQLGWLAIIMFVMVPNVPALQDNFAISYAIFFTFDLFKLVGMEYLYYHDKKWLHSITRTEIKRSL